MLAGAEFVGEHPARQDLQIEPFDPSKHKFNTGFRLPRVTNEEIQNFPEVLALKEQHKNLPVLVEGEHQCSRCDGKGKFVVIIRHCVEWLSGFKAEMSECWSCKGTGKKITESDK